MNYILRELAKWVERGNPNDGTCITRFIQGLLWDDASRLYAYNCAEHLAKMTTAITHEEFMKVIKASSGTFAYVGGDAPREQCPGNQIIYTQSIKSLTGNYDGICLYANGWEQAIKLVALRGGWVRKGI